MKRVPIGRIVRPPHTPSHLHLFPLRLFGPTFGPHYRLAMLCEDAQCCRSVRLEEHLLQLFKPVKGNSIALCVFTK